MRNRKVWKFTGIALILVGLSPFLFGEFIAGLSIGFLWPFTVLGISIGLFLWATAAGITSKLSKNINAAMSYQPIKGIGLGLALTAVFAVVMGFAFFWLIPYIQTETAADYRFVWTAVLVVALFAILPFVRLYKITGLPFDPDNLKKGTRGLAILVVIVMAYATHEQPNRMFDPNTGKATFLVADSEGEIYYRDPETCMENGGCFSPVTGEKLREGTVADAKQYQRESWKKRLEQMFLDLLGGDGDAPTSVEIKASPAIKKTNLTAENPSVTTGGEPFCYAGFNTANAKGLKVSYESRGGKQLETFDFNTGHHHSKDVSYVVVERFSVTFPPSASANTVIAVKYGSGLKDPAVKKRECWT